MADTKIKAGQFYGVVGHGTDGYFLMTNADGSMSWSQASTGPSVTSVTYPGDDTAADPAGDQTVILTGTNFGSSMTVSIGGTTAPSVAHDSSTQLTITTPAKAAGDYDIVVTNTVTGASGTFVNGISYNGVPTWTTATGSLGTFESETTISTITLQATEPDGGTITFNITNGALPSGLSLTGANIDGTTTAESSTTLYSFTIEAIDDENQSTPRNFSITVNAAALIPSENFTINTYTGNGSTQSIEGKIGTAAQFNGSSSVIDIPQGDLPTGSAARTISFWINTTQTTGVELFSYGTLSNNTYCTVNLNQNSSGQIGMAFFANDHPFSAPTINNGNWHHVCAVYNGNIVTLYLDGSSLGNSTAGAVNTSSAGSPKIGSTSFNGKLDQFRIFNKALSSSEVTTLYGEPSNPATVSKTDIFADGSGIALYEFEEGAKDTGSVTGYIGGGGIFDGSSSKIDLPSFGNTFENNFSYSLWFVLDSSPSGGISTLITTQGDYYNFTIIRDSDKKVETRFEYPGGGSNVLKSTSTFTDYGTWHHLTITKSSTNGAAIYIDGTLEASDATATSNLLAGVYGNTLGVYGSGTQYWLDGKIDQVRFFNKALSSSEVTTLYQETSASATKSTTDIFDDGSGVALYELERNANDTGGSFGSLVTGSKIDLDVDGYTSGSVADLSGNGNTATVTGATYGTDPNEGGYFDLDGSSDYLQISASTDFNSATNFTLEGWFNPDNLTATDHLFTVYDLSTAANRKFLLRLADADGDLEFVSYSSSGSGGSLTTSNPNVRVIANKWNHIALSFQYNGTIEAFINGISAGTSSSNGTMQTGGSGDLYIGVLNNYIGSYDFDGKVGDIRFYDSALTAAQVVQNFNASKGSYGVGYNGTATNVSYAYDGTPTNVSFVGTSFQPDLVWFKNRTDVVGHRIYDSARGVPYYLDSSSTAVSADAGVAGLTAFNSNGFSVGSGNAHNGSGDNIVAWMWKAGDSVVTDSSTGTLTANISANTEAGFSIVNYTGNQTSGATFPHGLDSAAEMVIIKNKSASTYWYVYHKDLDTNKNVYLNTADSQQADNQMFGAGANVVTVGSSTSVNSSTTDSMIAYCFHSVDGYQKVGSYSGSNSPITITTGFQPRFLMVKRIDTTGSWIIIDSAREIGSGADALFPDLNWVESSSWNTDFISTGFTISSNETWISASGGTYIYLAIA